MKGDEPTPCRFGDGPAVARFSLPRGCICYPDDREQSLCQHHAAKARANGVDMDLIADLTIDQEFTKWWRGE